MLLKMKAEKLDIVWRKVDELTPYKRNPRNNNAGIDALCESISRFGFNVPIVVDRDGVVICGHTRLKAAKKLKMESVPCVVADDLTDEQARAFRLVDNKVAELSTWNRELLGKELAEIGDSMTMEKLGFVVDGNKEVSDGGAGEISLEDFDDGKFKCRCPECGFVFNP